MKIIMLGATGNSSSRLVAEALSRGHEVTAVYLKPEWSGPIVKKSHILHFDSGM